MDFVKQTTLLLFLTFSFGLIAQIPETLIKPASTTNMFDDYEGSIYQNLRFIDGNVIDEKSGTYQTKLRYNIFKDAIEYRRGEKFFNVIKKTSIHAKIGNDYYYFCDFKTPRGLKESGYFVLVELNENYRIYKKTLLEITEPGTKKSALDAIEPGKIRSLTNYFLEEKGIVMKLPMSKKEIFVVFNDKKEELASYIKTQKIKLRKEEDLIRLVSKYSALKHSEDSQSRSLLSNNY